MSSEEKKNLVSKITAELLRLVSTLIAAGIIALIDSNLTVNRGAWIKRGLRVDGATSTGAITSTGLSTFGNNGGKATIPAGGIAKVYVSGLTTSGTVALGINKNGFVTVSDTLPSWFIPNNDTLYIRYKFNETVGYAILKK